MIEKQRALLALFRALQQVPYLSVRNSYKVLEHFLKMDDRSAELFCNTILRAKKEVARCTCCFCWQETQSGCLFCNDTSRNKKLICVVEGWLDVIFLERSGSFNGVYHVLNGVISPLDGITPEDLTVASLVQRVQENGVSEVVLGMSQTPEGEATMAFIAMKLKKVGVKIVSCLSRGMPAGSSIGDVDRLTVNKAFKDRRPY